MEDEHDKPTVILDFNKLKQELTNAEELLDESEVEELFDTPKVDSTESIEQQEHSIAQEDLRKPYALTFKTDFFHTNEFFISNQDLFTPVQDLKELNSVLRQPEGCELIVYYNSEPKVINQITSQIKQKFPKVKTLIIAKNLSAQKAQQHAASKFGANAYLSEPFEDKSFKTTLDRLRKDDD